MIRIHLVNTRMSEDTYSMHQITNTPILMFLAPEVAMIIFTDLDMCSLFAICHLFEYIRF